MGNNKIFKIIKSRRRANIPPLYDDNSTNRVNSDDDKCTLIANHFKKMHDNTREKSDIIFTLCTNNYVKQTIEQIHNNKDIIYIQSAEDHSIIKELKKGKATGLDRRNRRKKLSICRL